MDHTQFVVLIFMLMLCHTAMPYSIEKHILDSATKMEMFDLFHVMPKGHMNLVQELDMLLTLDQYKLLYMEKEPERDDHDSRYDRRKSKNSNKRLRRPKRKAAADLSKKWPKCLVYYEITESLDTRPDVKIIEEAIGEWEKYTCLNFIETTRVSKRIQFTDGDMCASPVGMQGEPQPIQLASGCRTKGIIAHEIGHAIGWFHEHMRPDRDDYLNIHLSAIPSKYRPNYKKYSTEVINTYGVPYDYTSIMHYGDTAFPGSMEARDPRFQSKLGQRDGFSFKDIKLANVMYDCARVMKCPQVLECGDGFQLYKEFKGEGPCQCWCDSGDANDPLVLCSKQRSRPLPPAITLPPPTAQPPMQCMDVRQDCKQMKDAGKCTMNMKSMMANCAKTCGFCGKGGNLCMDYEEGCGLMAGHCLDPGLRATMSQVCMATCDLCQSPPPDPCEIQKEMMGDVIGGGAVSSELCRCRLWMFAYVFALFFSSSTLT